MNAWKLRAVVLTIIALFVSSLPAAAQQPIKLRFGKLGPNLGMARAEIAESQGFFKKHALDVEVTQFRASPELLTAVVSGSIDVALSGATSVITARERKLPIRAFYVETVAPFYYLLASPNISSMQDAVDKGAAAGVSSVGSLDYTMTRYLFKRAGLDPDKIKYVQAGTPGQRTAALEAGRIQLAISAVPEKYAVLRRGKVREIAKISDYSQNFALETFWGTEDYLANNGEALHRFLAAMDDTAQWIRSSPDAPAVLAKFIGFSYAEGPDDVKEALKEVHYPTVAEHKAKLGDLLTGLEPLADDAIQRGALKADSPKALVHELFDSRYVQ